MVVGIYRVGEEDNKTAWESYEDENPKIRWTLCIIWCEFTYLNYLRLIKNEVGAIVMMRSWRRNDWWWWWVYDEYLNMAILIFTLMVMNWWLKWRWSECFVYADPLHHHQPIVQCVHSHYDPTYSPPPFNPNNPFFTLPPLADCPP